VGRTRSAGTRRGKSVEEVDAKSVRACVPTAARKRAKASIRATPSACTLLAANAPVAEDTSERVAPSRSGGTATVGRKSVKKAPATRESVPSVTRPLACPTVAIECSVTSASEKISASFAFATTAAAIAPDAPPAKASAANCAHPLLRGGGG